MKIAHLLDVRWNSGLAHYALALAAGQRQAGMDVTVWAPTATPAFSVAAGLGLETVRLDRPFFRLPQLRAELRRRAPDVVNAHTGRSHTLAILLTRGTGAAVVRTRSDARPPALRPGASWLYGRTQALAASCWAIAEPLGRASVPPAVREVIHPGIDLKAWPAAAPAPGGPVGVVARLDPVKGHDDLLRAAAAARKAMPELRFAAAGGDANLRRSDLEARARNLGLGPSDFRFEGHVADASAFMGACRFGVVASRDSEAVSRAALEWMASGRALVATAVGALPDLVEDGATGRLVPQGSPEALAAAILELASDPARAERMGRAARERVERRFSLRAFVETTDALYRRAIEAKRGAACP